MQSMNKSQSLIFILLLCGLYGYSQSNNLTGSPYSLFGLGTESNSGTGRNSGLGNTGISLDSNYGINLYNPAAFATLKENEITFDFGGSVEYTNLIGGDANEQRSNYNFTNISLAFNHNNDYGIGITLKPATNVGYSLIGLENNIEGSDEQFTTNITGTGGINELRLDYARTFFKNFNVGVKASFLFGKIEESESIVTSDSYLEIAESNYYNGAQFGLGLQYQLSEKHNLGFTIDLPTVLKGSKDMVVGKYSNAAYSTLEDTEGENIDNFYLPLKLGFGYSTNFKNLLLTADYSRKFWSDTNQSDAIGDYTDQNIFGLGASYAVDPTSYKYWKRVDFRMGLNYNSGYLKVDDTNIDTYSASLGIGLPIGNRSLVNISYTLGKKGTTESILIQEYVNTINVNISLSDLWFQKRKLN
ncbi:Long-chain fatty acid transport protein [Winogradskyella sediminis]|uniref:Long-chain fatty acid transport protein n=2 Tax=Winogradskyella sediminis TaxID=1382466 RepID=A0A1H1MWY1_9FLAO|nr:Long-chain fatty acid transport protein [Winogradskyella sediminis]